MSLTMDSQVVGFYQSYQNFTLWNVLKAGHMVPMDAPKPSFAMFNSIIYPDTNVQDYK
jgi:carboxypeptidase C (cathepsin A)